jgi:hypothetical protein
VLLLVIFVVVSCAPQTQSPSENLFNPETATTTPQPTIGQDYPGPMEITPSPGLPYPDPPSEAVNPTPYPVPESSLPIATQETAPIKEGLIATDPVLVNLASGKPTFVEFFAFW